MAKDELDDATIKALIKAIKVKKQLNGLDGDFDLLVKDKDALLKLIKKEGKAFSKVAKEELNGFKDAFLGFLLP